MYRVRNSRVLLFLVVLLLPTMAANALGIVVTSANDSGTGTLREALTAANAADEDVSIIFDVSLAPVLLAEALPILTNPNHRILIDGGGTAVIDGSALLSGNGIDVVGSTVELQGVTVLGFPGAGVSLSGADASTVRGCVFGIDGDDILGNGTGIRITASENARIGGPAATDRNVISGSTGFGIEILSNVIGLTVQGNYIGTSVDGLSAVGNSLGITFGGGAGSGLIGGPGAGEGNVISGNDIYGMSLSGDGANLQIQGNLIGLNANGVGPLSNGSTGILLSVASNYVIGGDAPGAGNFISGNTMQGILVGACTGLQIVGNRVGLGTDDSTIIANLTGIEIGNTDATMLVENVVSGNRNHGVLINGNSTGITLQGNAIGVEATRSVLRGNGLAGIQCNAVSEILIGGAEDGADNAIAGNTTGIDVVAGQGITMRRNAIYANSDTGIALAAGTNNDIAPPVITELGSVFGTAGALETVDIFVDEGGQGRVPIASVTADDVGDFFSPVNLAQYDGMNITATATDAQGNTSEFSAPFLIEDVAPEFHTADQDQDGTITLSELLRVIQFYNSTGLSCVVPPVSSEDGYLPVPGFKGCGSHSADYNPTDWVIDLRELLRLIQFFNSAGYIECFGGEDGFCPVA